MSASQISGNQGGRRDPKSFGNPDLPFVKVSRETLRNLDHYNGRAILDVRASMAQNDRKPSSARR